jgi:hypothetical protein
VVARWQCRGAAPREMPLDRIALPLVMDGGQTRTYRLPLRSGGMPTDCPFSVSLPSVGLASAPWHPPTYRLDRTR